MVHAINIYSHFVGYLITVIPGTLCYDHAEWLCPMLWAQPTWWNNGVLDKQPS